MSTIKNKVQLIGCLGSDPEVRVTTKGQKCARLSLATHESYRNNTGELISETHWHTLLAWGKLAELAKESVYKGQQIAVEGKLVYRRFTDAQGVARKEAQIILSGILPLGPRDRPPAIDAFKALERRA